MRWWLWAIIGVVAFLAIVVWVYPHAVKKGWVSPIPVIGKMSAWIRAKIGLGARR